MRTLVETKDLTRDEWLKWRQYGIGGSDAAAALNCNPYMSSFGLWMDKKGKTPSQAENDYMKWGHILEGVIADQVAIEHGFRVRRRNAILQHETIDHMLANIDRWAYLEDGTRCILECKFSMTGERWEDGPPLPYVIQCQHMMAVTETNVAILAALVFDQPFSGIRPFVLHRDEELIAEIIEGEAMFWKMVQDDTPPAPDARDFSDYFNHVYLDPNMYSVIQTKDNADADVAAGRYKALGPMIKALKDEQTEIKLRLAIALGGSKFGLTPNYCVTGSTWETNNFDVTAFKKDHPDLFDQYRRMGHSSRVTVKDITKISQKVRDELAGPLEAARLIASPEPVAEGVADAATE